MNYGMTLASAIGIGASAMYLLDPDAGRRRRAILEDKAVKLMNDSNNAANIVARDMSNRAMGVAADMRYRVKGQHPSDRKLIARVRSKLGRLVAHPGAVFVTVQSGRVTLRGPILAGEQVDLLAGIASVPGVQSIDNQLEVHSSPGHVPGLQGLARQHVQPGMLSTNMTPTARFLVGLAGGTLTLQGMARRGIAGKAMSLVGALMFAESVSGEINKLLSMPVGDEGIIVNRAININAPLERVFAVLSHPENYSKFMHNVRQVQSVGDGRTRWEIHGPLGMPVRFDSVVTQFQPNQLIAWKSVDQATVTNSGELFFRPNERGGTTVYVTLTYAPPGGTFGNIIASFLGADPKRELVDDLVRLKTFIETGKRPHDNADREACQSGTTMETSINQAVV